MNIEEMLESQMGLDERICKQHSLSPEETFTDTVAALIVELAEMANEARFFKYWSEDRELRTTAPCWNCHGEGSGYFAGEAWTGEKEACKVCLGCGLDPDANPLLEEYADALHFFLSIAHKKGWERALKVPSGSIRPKARDASEVFIDTIHLLTACRVDVQAAPLSNGMMRDEMAFHLAWLNFIEMGRGEFHLTTRDMERAYFEKNRINHERQDRGY